MALDLTKLDLEALLTSLDIEWKSSGENVGRHCTGICCPFCDDNNFHLGIFKSGKNFSCWKCRTTGSLFDLLSAIRGISWKEYVQLISQQALWRSKDAVGEIQRIFAGTEEETPLSERQTYNVLPEYTETITEDSLTRSPLLQRFLSERDISLATLIASRVAVGRAGDFCHRLVVPIYEENEMVGYQGRDLTGKANLKYLTPAGFNIMDYLYNVDFVEPRSSIILVEGIIDAWRLGFGTVATFSTVVSAIQRSKLFKLKPTELVFAWDSDAYGLAKKQAEYWAPLVDKVKVIRFPDGHDPDSFGEEGTKALIREALSL